MVVWTFLYVLIYAFLTSVTLITLVIGVVSVLMGTVNKDRGWVVFGLKALLVMVLAAAILFALLYHQIIDWLNK